MVLYNIYNEVLIRQYRAHVCSFSTVFCIVVGIITYLSPLLIAYNTFGFWLHESTYREQPEVVFNHDFLIITQGSTLLGYSTYQNFNKMLGDNLRIVSLKSREVDENQDGRNDYLSYEIEIPLSTSQKVTSIQLLLFFNYKLYAYATVEMQSLAYISHQSQLSGSAFYTDGFLQFVQKYPLPHRGYLTNFNVSIIEKTATSAETLNLHTIFREYQKRNMSTDFIGRYPMWQTGSIAGQPFTIKGRVYYPEQTIIYRPGFWQVMKHAWTQYITILFIFVLAMAALNKFIYENKLVDTIVRKEHKD